MEGYGIYPLPAAWARGGVYLGWWEEILVGLMPTAPGAHLNLGPSSGLQTISF